MENYQLRPSLLSSSELFDRFHGDIVSTDRVIMKDDEEEGLKFDLLLHNSNNKNMVGTEITGTTSYDNNLSEKNKKMIMKSSPKQGRPKAKRHRFAFQTRSQVDVLDDGYRWRKYGQKTVKNSRFPRSYYKCTYQGCNVKKQIQRLCKDEGVVVTTYEGIHNHSTDHNYNENFDHILRTMQTSYANAF